MSCDAVTQKMRMTVSEDTPQNQGQQYINERLKLTMIVVGGFVIFLIIVLLIRMWMGHKISVDTL